MVHAQWSQTLSFYISTLEAHLRPGVPLLLSPYFQSPFKNEGRGFLSDLLPFGASFF